jgi:hypothetical protein
MTQVARRDHEQQAPLVPAPITPMEMLDRAVQSGANVETLDKLMALQERWEKNQARKAFDQAIADAKARIRPVVRNRIGHNSKAYADFAAVATAVDPILSELGLSYRFHSEQGERINVTCVLSHRDGHSEQTTLSGPPDKTGNKNDVQAIGSTLTYLQRYSLVQMLGLAAADDDDAGRADMSVAVSDEQLSKLIELADEVDADKRKFCEYISKAWRVEIKGFAEIPAAKFDAAVAALEAKRKRK